MQKVHGRVEMTSLKTLQTPLRSRRQKVVCQVRGGPCGNESTLTGPSWQIFEGPAKNLAGQRQYVAGRWLTDYMRRSQPILRTLTLARLDAITSSQLHDVQRDASEIKLLQAASLVKQ